LVLDIGPYSMEAFSVYVSYSSVGNTDLTMKNQEENRLFKPRMKQYWYMWFVSFSQVTFVTRNVRVKTSIVNTCFGEERSVLYTQHYQIHCFWEHSAHLEVAYAVCHSYNTNKIRLGAHRLLTHYTFSTSRWLGLFLLSMFCLMRFD